MAHKTKVGGTDYEIKGGRTLVNGTGYGIKKGRTMVDGTGYDVSFAKEHTISIVGYSNSDSKYANVTINGTVYGTNLQLGVYQYIKVDSGTEITLQVMSMHPAMSGYVKVDGVFVAETSAANTPVTYLYTVESDITIEVAGTAMGPNIIITSN